MDFPRFSFLYNNYKAYIPIVSFPQCCCSRISLLLHRPDFHHWIWGPDSKDTVGQGFTPGIIELSLNWKELILSIFKFQLVTIIIVIELKYIDFFVINSQFPAGDNHLLNHRNPSLLPLPPASWFLHQLNFFEPRSIFFMYWEVFLVTVLRHNQFVFEYLFIF